MTMFNKAKILKNKQFKKIIAHIEEHLGEFQTGLLIAILADSIDNLSSDGVDHIIRNIEITYNDIFSYKADINKEIEETIERLTAKEG